MIQKDIFRLKKNNITCINKIKLSAFFHRAEVVKVITQVNFTQAIRNNNRN